jgi:hypothetical protein
MADMGLARYGAVASMANVIAATEIAAAIPARPFRVACQAKNTKKPAKMVVRTNQRGGFNK